MIELRHDRLNFTFAGVHPDARLTIDLQRTLARTSGSLADAVEVRIAVTAGDVLMQDGDIFGTPVNLVARLEGETPAGETSGESGACSGDSGAGRSAAVWHP